MAQDIPKSEPFGVGIKLRQKVYEQIRRAIVTCELAPGAHLSEATLAQWIETSKTPVREALTSLVQDGLVEYIPNRGFTVAQITLKDIQEIFEVRLYFETILFQLAIKSITESELQKLEALNKEQYDWNDPDATDRCVEDNTEFHLTIAKASHSSRLIRYYKTLLDEAQRLIYMDFRNNRQPYTSHVGHQQLVEALRSRDEEAGRKVLEDMLSNGKKRILGLEEYS